MLLDGFFETLNEFAEIIKKKIKVIYQNSSLYEKKISKTLDNEFIYKPSPNLLDCLIKYEKKKKNIENFYLNSVWQNKEVNEKDYKKLHSFFWLFSIDLKSSKKITQSIILNWIEVNEKYNYKNWEVDTLSKRVISWISNSQLTYDESDQLYKKRLNDRSH